MTVETDFWNDDLYKFELPGYEPDVRFRVFGKPVEAHSIILKIHSPFLREILDLSKPTEEQEHLGTRFSYEYVTMLDNCPDGRLDELPRGIWSIRKERSPFIDTADWKYKWNEERDAFVQLLQVMYGRPLYVGGRLKYLEIMIRLADTLGALPALSRSITIAMTSPQPWGISDEKCRGLIQYHAHSFLIIAEKLRNPWVFRESLVHMAARWDRSNWDVESQNWLLASHPHIYTLVKFSYADMCTKIMKTEAQLTRVVQEGISHRQHWQGLEVESLDFLHRRNLESTYDYYKRIFRDCEVLSQLKDDRETFCLEIASVIEPLMRENLHFPSGYLVPLWYCAEIADKDLPWDASQLAW